MSSTNNETDTPSFGSIISREKRHPITGKEIFVKIAKGKHHDQWVVIGEGTVGFMGDPTRPFTPLYDMRDLAESDECHAILQAVCEQLAYEHAYSGSLEKVLAGGEKKKKMPFFSKGWYHALMGAGSVSAIMILAYAACNLIYSIAQLHPR